jgi:serine/threonine protein kinase
MGAHQYDISVDVWGAGCIIAEMITGIPLFTGDSEMDQLNKIFKLLGTPNENLWPGFQSLPNFGSGFPEQPPQRLETVISSGDPLLINLVAQLLEMNPAKRISALKALSHPYFATVPRPLIEICVPAGVTVHFPEV